MMLGVLVFGGFVLLTLPSDWPDEAWVWAVVLLAVLVGGVLAATLGLRARPIPAGTPQPEARRLALAALSSTTMMRAAVTEAPAIIALALAFVADSWVVYAVGAAMSLLLLAGLAWPNGTVLERLEAALDADGARSRLGDLAAGRTR